MNLPETLDLPTLREVQLGPYSTPEKGPKCGCIYFHLDHISGDIDEDGYCDELDERLYSALHKHQWRELVSSKSPNTLRNRRRALQLIEDVVRDAGYEIES